MSDTQTYEAQARELSQKLWAIANDLRGSMDASQFKDYILGLIFYRYLSERTEKLAKELLKNDGLTYKEAFEDDEYREAITDWSLNELGYVIKPENLFADLVRRIGSHEEGEHAFSIEDLRQAISDLTESTLGQPSEKAFVGLFDSLGLETKGLGASVSERTKRIASVMSRINNINFDMEESQFDVLGTAYMMLIGLFASDAGKKAGEFFTPTGPAKLCAMLAADGLDEAKSVGDCTCGSASMLLEVKKHLTKQRVGHFYGQENNIATYNLARMNMIIHGIPWDNFDIYLGDTLLDDEYEKLNRAGDEKLTIQVGNPPYSLKWSSNKKLLNDPRYAAAGKLAPKGYADLAFVEHMIYHMDENDGRCAVLLPHGVLFREKAEETIRKYLVENLNVLDAVIGLPANLFYSASLPVCVLVFKNNRGENANNILFIDASKEFKAGKNSNILTDANIEKIMDTYRKRTDVDKFAHVASMEEIIENDYNLNIPRYVDTSEEEPRVDLENVFSELDKVRAHKHAMWAEIGLAINALDA